MLFTDIGVARAIHAERVKEYNAVEQEGFTVTVLSITERIGEAFRHVRKNREERPVRAGASLTGLVQQDATAR
ncbi:MAG TPA: hypothetical protein VGK87_04400 [Anaerolineae bacterium]|jgi:hypothetical protein